MKFGESDRIKLKVDDGLNGRFFVFIWEENGEDF